MTDDKICELAQRPYRGKESGNRLIAYMNGCFDNRDRGWPRNKLLRYEKIQRRYYVT